MTGYDQFLGDEISDVLLKLWKSNEAKMRFGINVSLVESNHLGSHTISTKDQICYD